MLAQNFLDAQTLGITERERDALIRVLGMMERGEIRDAIFSPGEVIDINYNGEPLRFFNMRLTNFKASCGAVGCIRGWAQEIDKDSFLVPDHLPKPLSMLFYPTCSVCNPYDATVMQAAQALRNYLTRGEARWEDVMRA